MAFVNWGRKRSETLISLRGAPWAARSRTFLRQMPRGSLTIDRTARVEQGMAPTHYVVRHPFLFYPLFSGLDQDMVPSTKSPAFSIPTPLKLSGEIDGSDFKWDGQIAVPKGGESWAMPTFGLMLMCCVFYSIHTRSAGS